MFTCSTWFGHPQSKQVSNFDMCKIRDRVGWQWYVLMEVQQPEKMNRPFHVHQHEQQKKQAIETNNVPKYTCCRYEIKWFWNVFVHISTCLFTPIWMFCHLQCWNRLRSNSQMGGFWPAIPAPALPNGIKTTPWRPVDKKPIMVLLSLHSWLSELSNIQYNIQPVGQPRQNMSRKTWFKTLHVFGVNTNHKPIYSAI